MNQPVAERKREAASMYKAKIEVEGLSKIFSISGNGAGPQQFTALRDINLEVKNGEFLSIVGPSGCGKSSLLDIIGGLTKPSAGKILIDGKPIDGPGLDRGIVFQQYTLFPWLTALRNVEFVLEAKKGTTKAERRDVARQYLSMMGLSGFEDRYPHELSGGMKQRVALARALAIDPDVLLMDEPFAALDAQTRETQQCELLRIWEKTNKTIVFITHDIDEAVFLGQRVALMTTRPGQIKQVIDVPLPDSRHEEDDLKSFPEFAATRHEVWSALREEVIKSQDKDICGACDEPCDVGQAVA